MKNLIYFLAITLVASLAVARPVTYKFESSACETNAAAVTTYTPAYDAVINGYVDAVIYDQTGTGTGTLNVSTLASQGTGASRAILTDTTTSADGAYPVRDLVTTQAGADGTAVARIPLVGDKLRLTLYNWDATNNTAVVYVVVDED